MRNRVGGENRGRDPGQSLAGSGARVRGEGPGLGLRTEGGAVGRRGGGPGVAGRRGLGRQGTGAAAPPLRFDLAAAAGGGSPRPSTGGRSPRGKGARLPSGPVPAAARRQQPQPDSCSPSPTPAPQPDSCTPARVHSRRRPPAAAGLRGHGVPVGSKPGSSAIRRPGLGVAALAPSSGVLAGESGRYCLESAPPTPSHFPLTTFPCLLSG